VTKGEQLRFQQACVAFGLPKPVCEFQFHPVRKWRIDFYWHDARLALEAEGAVWTNGRHTRGAGFVGDMEKYNELTCVGIRLLRVPTHKIFTKATFDLLKRCIYANTDN
jgi:very-short-patch-repair endonuclease